MKRTRLKRKRAIRNRLIKIEIGKGERETIVAGEYAIVRNGGKAYVHAGGKAYVMTGGKAFVYVDGEAVGSGKIINMGRAPWG